MLPQQPFPAAPEDSSTEISGQEPSQSLSPASERGWRAVQIALGVAFPLVAGVLVWGIPRLWAVPDLFDAAGPFITALVVTALLTFVGALLLHSSWALGIVPATWMVGETLGTAVAYSSVTGRSPLSSALWWQEVGQVSATLALLGIPLTLICAGLGVLIDRWLQRRWR
jgi:hypothetical protein